MARSAATKATEATDALLAWLRTQPSFSIPRRDVSEADRDVAAVPLDGAAVEAGLSGGEEIGTSETRMADAPPEASPLEAGNPVANEGRGTSEAVRRGARPAGQDSGGCQTAPLCLPHTDWLHHRLTVTGPADQIACFRAAAAGAGIIPWHLDLDRREEDWFHLLVSPPKPQRRSLSLAGARVLAGQLREAVARRHERAVARVGRSSACPLDLHALLPVPEEILRLGPDHPDALGWLWTHWGTTQGLRRVAEDVAVPETERRWAASADGAASGGQAAFHLTFWSADWTPWRALAQLTGRWLALRFDTRPSYDAS